MQTWTSRQDLQFAPYKDVVQRLLARIHCFAPPVDIEALAKLLEVDEIRREDLGEVSGSLIRGKRRNFILLNSSQSRERQRFTLAHELAHLYFGDNHEEGSVQWRRPLSTRDNRERRCDAFASELLMPWHLIHSRLDESPNIATVVELARDFQVSIESAALRLGSLSTEPIQIIAWQKEKGNLIQKWSVGIAHILPKEQGLDLSNKFSSAVQATLVPSAIRGSEKIYRRGKISTCESESRAFGKTVFSILRKRPRRAARVQGVKASRE